MDRNPSATSARLSRRLRRLGSDAVCVLCGYTNPFGLIQVHRSLLEDHHVVTRAHDPEFVVAICRNCHGEVTELLLREGIQPSCERDVQKRTALMLTALAVFLEALATSVRRWAQALKETFNEK
jgi:hypothetical protein